MTDGKIYRLITVGLWIGFCAGLFWILLFLDQINRMSNPIGFILESALFEEDATLVALFWLYPLMLGAQYVVEGEFKWLPSGNISVPSVPSVPSVASAVF